MGFLKRAYIGIFLSHDGAHIAICVGNKNSVSIETKIYLGLGYSLSQEAKSLVNSLQKKYPYTYVGISSFVKTQGVVFGFEAVEALSQKGHVNGELVDVGPIDAEGYGYLGRSDIKRLKQECDDIGGVDFLFSPYAVLWAIARKQNNKGVNAYVVVQQDMLMLIVVDNHRLIYGAQRDFSTHTPDIVDQSMAIDSSDDVVFDDYDEIRLDDLEFDMTQEVGGSQDDEPLLDAHEGDSQDLELLAISAVSFIQTEIRNFYDSDACEGRFIDSVVMMGWAKDYIADTLIHQVERATMLEAQWASIELSAGVCHLVMMEDGV